MEKVLQAILSHLEQLSITGKDAERMVAIKSMVRDMIAAIRSEEQAKSQTEAR